MPTAMVTKPEHPMKNLIFSLMLAFAVIGGAATVLAAATHPVYADGHGN
jgi:hypothetical protein